jgi:hypothetical protein
VLDYEELTPRRQPKTVHPRQLGFVPEACGTLDTAVPTDGYSRLAERAELIVMGAAILIAVVALPAAPHRLRFAHDRDGSATAALGLLFLGAFNTYHRHRALSA